MRYILTFIGFLVAFGSYGQKRSAEGQTEWNTLLLWGFSTFSEFWHVDSFSENSRCFNVSDYIDYYGAIDTERGNSELGGDFTTIYFTSVFGDTVKYLVENHCFSRVDPDSLLMGYYIESLNKSIFMEGMQKGEEIKLYATKTSSCFGTMTEYTGSIFKGGERTKKTKEGNCSAISLESDFGRSLKALIEEFDNIGEPVEMSDTMIRTCYVEYDQKYLVLYIDEAFIEKLCPYLNIMDKK